MGGRASRQKGMRREYEVRDHLRKFGYTADRVPLSGASQGFKGDIRAKRGETITVFEVKARVAGFDSVYHLFNQNAVLGLLCLEIEGEGEPTLCRISTDPDLALQSGGVYEPIDHFRGSTVAVLHRTGRKCMKMKDWLQGADVLVIRQDRQPLLYIRYL